MVRKAKVNATVEYTGIVVEYTEDDCRDIIKENLEYLLEEHDDLVVTLNSVEFSEVPEDYFDDDSTDDSTESRSHNYADLDGAFRFNDGRPQEPKLEMTRIILTPESIEKVFDLQKPISSKKELDILQERINKLKHDIQRDN